MSEPAITNCIHCGADPAELARLRESQERLQRWVRERDAELAGLREDSTEAMNAVALQLIDVTDERDRLREGFNAPNGRVANYWYDEAARLRADLVDAHVERDLAFKARDNWQDATAKLHRELERVESGMYLDMRQELSDEVERLHEEVETQTFINETLSADLEEARKLIEDLYA